MNYPFLYYGHTIFPDNGLAIGQFMQNKRKSWNLWWSHTFGLLQGVCPALCSRMSLNTPAKSQVLHERCGWSTVQSDLSSISSWWLVELFTKGSHQWTITVCSLCVFMFFGCLWFQFVHIYHHCDGLCQSFYTSIIRWDAAEFELCVLQTHSALSTSIFSSVFFCSFIYAFMEFKWWFHGLLFSSIYSNLSWPSM